MEYDKVKINPPPSCAAVHAANSLQKAEILISVKQIQGTSLVSEVSRLTRTLEVRYFVKHSLQFPTLYTLIQPSFYHPSLLLFN